MKRLWASVFLVFLLLGSVSLAQAQVSLPTAVTDTGNAAPDFSATSAAKATLDSLAVGDSFARPAPKLTNMLAAPPLATPLPAEPAEADPATPSPKPKFIYGGRDDYRWQLGLSFAWVRFQSSGFDANTFGLKTAVTYFLNDWLGVEGSFTGAFGSPPSISKNQDAKVGLYGGGPKIAWRQRRWEPWIHGIFGGAHEGPQTAAGSQNSYSIQLGGGGDYRWNPRISFRVESDYVRTGFFHQSQNNVQVAGGIVFHF